jgi:hypothetical protein
MFAGIAGSSWQQCFNAVALGSKDLKLSTELLLNPIDQQSDSGQFIDYYDESRLNACQVKPPIQGWGLKLLMKKHDLAKEIPHDKLEMLYEGHIKWANWYTTCRDNDHDGIPQYESGAEGGMDDDSRFQISNEIETPELCAYLGLLYEALGDIAKMLGKPQNEIDEWYRRSKDIIDKMIKTFWNGERFIAIVSGSHEVVVSDTVSSYLPIVLGKRLPQEIIDKLAGDLSVEGDYLTPYGLSSEKLSSDYLSLGMHMSLAYVLPPTNMLICTGLYDAGKTDLATKIARRYCRTLKDGGFIMLVNPFRGMAGRSGGSWAACAYVILADMLSW